MLVGVCLDKGRVSDTPESADTMLNIGFFLYGTNTQTVRTHHIINKWFGYQGPSLT